MSIFYTGIYAPLIIKTKKSELETYFERVPVLSRELNYANNSVVIMKFFYTKRIEKSGAYGVQHML